MSCEDRIRLVRLVVGLGGAAGIGSRKELEEIANEPADQVSAGQLRLLADVAHLAARLLEDEARSAEAA